MCVGRLTCAPADALGLAPRFAGLWVVRASIPTPRANGAQTMSTLSIKSRNTKSAGPKKGSARLSLIGRLFQAICVAATLWLSRAPYFTIRVGRRNLFADILRLIAVVPDRSFETGQQTGTIHAGPPLS